KTTAAKTTAAKTTAAKTTSAKTTAAKTTSAQTTPTQTTPSQTTASPIVLCDTLTGQTTGGVQRRLNQYSNLVRGRRCIVLTADPAEDLAQLINGLPEDIVILLSSNSVPTSVPTMTPSSSVTPVSGKTPVNYLIHGEIVLKEGQDIIGAADDGFEIVIMLDESYRAYNMIVVGDSGNSIFGETKDNNIRHITFRPNQPKGRRRTNALVSAWCYNQSLIIAHNVLHLPDWVGVKLDCRQPLDASISDSRSGPGLLIANNTFKAETFNVGGTDLIPMEAVVVITPTIKNQSQRVAIIDNTFQGKLSEAVEFSPGPGSSIDIFRNRIDIDNTGTTYREYMMGRSIKKSGITFEGITDADAEPPLFNLAGNRILVRNTAIDILGRVKLAMACNHMEGIHPWRQEQHQYSLKAVDPLPLARECKRSLSSTVGMATTRPPALCQIVNSWRAVEASPANYVSGLSNLEGQFYFDPAICPTVASPSAVINSTNINSTKDTGDDDIATSSAPATVATTALSIMTTLALLLNQ
ncbi:hypothetical protein, partial [Endozoicomonas sp. SESOKO2]|uniref:hypothetical protein n=1 Tax=Endozoicomonas sp. SESOKO2 TaxID=2828743 RepID=UPI002147B9AA